MERQYSNTALSILRDLVVLDRYQRASDRPNDDEFAVTAGNVSLFEIFLSRLLDSFLDLDQEMMRNGTRPMEIHLETGAGASQVTPSALIAALFGKTFLELDAPENLERFETPLWAILLLPPFSFLLHFFRGEFRGGINDLNLRPAVEEGDITIAWNINQQGLVITLQFETAGTEIKGIADIAEKVEGDITQLELSIVLKPEKRAKRLFWELELVVDVEAESFIPTISNNELEDKIRTGLEKILRDKLKKDIIQVISSILSVIPLRPVQENPAGLANIQQNLDADIDWYNDQFNQNQPHFELPAEMLPPARLQEGNQAQLFVALVLDGLNQSIYNAALLPSNFRHLLPTSREFLQWILRNLDLEGLQETLDSDPDLDLASRLAIIEVYLRDNISLLVEQFARKHLELSHLVNRTDSYSEIRIEEDEFSGEARLIVEHEPLPDVPNKPGIVCMRYRVALESITFLNPGASGTTRIECSIGVWHPLLEIEDAEHQAGVIDDDEVAELDKLETTAPIVLGQAGLNLETTSFLEWGGKLRLSGKVEAEVLGSTEEFVHDIDITPEVGLFKGDGETVTGQFTPLSIYTIHYRLQQLPYAQTYDWVRVTFNKIELPPVSISQFPQGVSLLIEAFVNKDRNENDSNTAPFRREFFNNFTQKINLSNWTYDVIYPEDDIGSELSIELHAVLINPIDGEEIRRFEPARRVIPRFSNLQKEEVSGDNLIEAAADGAVMEWGIPAGLPGKVFMITDENEQLRITFTLRNERFDPVKVPTGFQPKTFNIEFPSVRIENDTDHGLSGVGEVRFTCNVEVREQDCADDEPPIPYPAGQTQVLEAEDPIELELPGPPASPGVVARPGDELIIEVSGLDFDWPPIDPNDRMGKATVRRTVPEGDDLDHRIAGLLSERSNTHDFEARIRIITTSLPPEPRFFFSAPLYPDLTEYEVPVGTLVTLEYDRLVEWATSGRLARSFDNGTTWEEEAPLNTDDPADTFEVTINQSTLYRLEVTNVAGTTFSRILKVGVQ